MKHMRSSGFTLIELMITLFIMSILISIAVPSFSYLIKKNNVEALQSQLSSAVATARSEAASRNVLVSICKSSNGTGCDGTDAAAWPNGWIVFTNKDNDAVVDDEDEIIDVFESRGNSTLKSTEAADADENAIKLSFSSQGFLIGEEVIFTVCEPDNEASYARGLYINKSGLIMKTTDTDDDEEVHNIPGGADLDCTP